MRINRLIQILLLFVFYLLFTACNTTKHVPNNQQLLSGNLIESTSKNIDIAPIYNYLKQKPNTKTALFFNFHLWIYNISHDKDGQERKLKKWLGIYKMGDIIGEPPVIMDTSLNQLSVRQIQKYMRNRGYYRSYVKDSLELFGRNDKRALVYYLIAPKKPIKIDSISYSIKDTSIRRIVLSDTSQTLLKKGINLDVDIMQQERVRLTKLLKDFGFYKFSKEYIYYEVDTSKSDYTSDIKLIILNATDSTLHHQFAINQIYYFNDFNPQDYLKEKEDYLKRFDTLSYGGNYFLSRKKAFIKPKVIKNASYLTKGDLYSASNIQNTFRHLSSLNEFKLINIRYNELQDTSKLNVLVQLTPFKKHNYIAEIEGTNSSGNMGIGGRLSYQHKSLFGGAEILNVSIYGKVESQNTFAGKGAEDISFNSDEIGANISLHFPKFLLPFKSDRFVKNNNPRTALEFTMNNKNRPEYTRSIYGASFGYYWVSKRYFRHQFKPFDLSAVKVFNMAPEYFESIQNTYLEKSFDDYLISASNYTLYFSNKKEKKGRNYFSFIFNGELAGNLLNAYSTISGAKPIGGSYYVLNNKFAQYWRAELDIRFYLGLKRKKDHLIYRVYGGMVHPYGNITATPYVKQFYSGGANGLRAWPVRSLGPGSYFNSDRKYYNEAADLKLEGNLEYRYKLFWVMEGAVFLDVGNIWATNLKDPRPGAQFQFKDFYKEIAIGTGFGFRFDFSFFILRLDYGIKLRDPKESEINRWVIFNKSYNPFGAEYSMFNFGIGYPF